MKNQKKKGKCEHNGRWEIVRSTHGENYQKCLRCGLKQELILFPHHTIVRRKFLSLKEFKEQYGQRTKPRT